MLKILLADDHPLFREGVRHILAELDTALDVIEASSAQAAVDTLTAHDDIDLVLLDLNMPGMDGFAGFDAVWSARPAVPVVMLSASEDAADIAAAREAGAAGYIPKSANSRTMLNALSLVLDGGTYFPRLAHPKTSGQGALPEPLSPRQQQILTLLAEGHANKAIAERLFLSESTVKGHIRTLYQLLEVSNRVQAINKAKQLGLLD